MATLKDTIKSWFQTGLKPTQEQFWAWMDSFWHKDEKIPITAIDDIEGILDAKADAEALTNHLTDADAHSALFEAKENTANKGVADGYAPLDELAKIAAVYLNIVDDLTTGGSDALASAETVKTLKGLIDGINTILGSDNVNLNSVQELVDAIETVQTSLSTILVNDLTTGGVTKALTAEQGKVLKGLIDNKPVSTLSQVLAAGNSAQSTDGASSFRVTLSGVLEFFSQMVSGTSGGVFKNSVGRSFLRNYTADNDTTFDINAGVPSISRYKKVGGTWFGTIFNFTPPTANTTINLPAKPAGTYTLATTADAIATIQSLMGQSAFLDDVFNGVYGYDGTDIDFFTGGPFARNFRIQVANPNDSGRRNGLQLNNYKAEFTGSFEGVWSVAGINNGRVLLSEFCEYENPVTGSLTEVTMELRFERPTSNSNIRIPAPPIDGTYKAALVGGLAPATATSPGAVGEIRYDANYAYFCVATDTWKRTPLTTW